MDDEVEDNNKVGDEDEDERGRGNEVEDHNKVKEEDKDENKEDVAKLRLGTVSTRGLT